METDIKAQTIMHEFANATGLINSLYKRRRYLWTDAFAVCNFLTSYRKTSDPTFLQMALQLVEQVHQTLGRFRKNDHLNGWLSGLNDQQALEHPTQGGLRIGKPLNERQIGEPINETREWDQDGQYFHYLTKWMHALNCVSRDSGEAIYNQWAIELAKAAYRAFSYTPAMADSKRLYWKMSIDLSRPLVSSMGQHDPLDGFITFHQLQATAATLNIDSTALSLKSEIAELATLCEGLHWQTNDSLGIGGLLSDAYRLLQLIDNYQLQETERLERLLHDIEKSLQSFVIHNPFKLEAEYRLPFRELGLAIGLQAISRMYHHLEKYQSHLGSDDGIQAQLEKLLPFHSIHKLIENFWLEADNQLASSWQQHHDINSVMLATSLAPDGYLHI